MHASLAHQGELLCRYGNGLGQGEVRCDVPPVLRNYYELISGVTS